MPILETVYVPLFGTTPGRVTSLSYYGSVPIQPADSITIRVRAPYPTTLLLLVNGRPLPQIAPGAAPPSPDDAGYYSPTVQPLPGPASAWEFWSIFVKLPKPFRFVSANTNVSAFTVTLRDISAGAYTGIQKQAPDLDINMAAYDNCAPPNCHPAASVSLAPSEAFLTGENSKDDREFPHLARASLGRPTVWPVTLAGWLKGGEEELVGTDEDWHFSIRLDNDFIQRNYPPNTLPFQGAMIWGQPEKQFCFVDAHFQLATPGSGCMETLPLASGSVPDIGWLLMPGANSNGDDGKVELNAWHQNARGGAPLGYQKNSTTGDNNFWAFDPVHGTHFPPNAPQHELKKDDYVIITGTLWQDACHNCTGISLPADPVDVCWDRAHPGDAGWLEIHPADVVRFVSPPPTLRRHPFIVSACSESGTYAKFANVMQLGTPPDELSVLRWQELPDPRFTDPDSSHIAKSTGPACGTDGTFSVLSIYGSDYNPSGMSTYKSAFLLWWEESPTPRQHCASATATIVGQSPLTVAVTVTDVATKRPMSGVNVSVENVSGYSQSQSNTGADGTVRLAFGPCASSGPFSATLGYVPSPACRIRGGFQYPYDQYGLAGLWTPVLAAKATLSGTNVSVSVTDPLTKTPAGDATVNLLDGQGRALVSGKTAADGTVTLDSSGCSRGIPGILASCRGLVMKAGYLNCSFAVMAGKGQCSGDYAGATAAASTITNGPATITGGPLTGTAAQTGQLSGGPTSNATTSLRLLSATVCPTVDGKSCLSAGQVRPGSPLMDIVTVTSGGSPVAGATVSVSGQPTFTATTNASGAAVITHLQCYALGTQVPKVGQTTVPLRTPVPCQATVTMTGNQLVTYQPVNITLP